MTFQTVGPARVSADAAQVHKELAERDLQVVARSQIAPTRPLFDIVFDWTAIVLAVVMVNHWGAVTAIPAILIIGNRQRALGNLLHEAGHRNLCREPWLNDMTGRLFLAPALLINLERYRHTHARHHAMLGISARDPDYILPSTARFPDWWRTYHRLLFSRAYWRGAMLGHLADPKVGMMCRLALIGWWVTFCLLLASMAGSGIAFTFVVLWHIAKATCFHAITVLREMCDHYGLKPGGIFSFTRDIVGPCHLRWLIHPHNNGYHLTHHLMPAVPYYRLPAAWKAVSRLPSYQASGVVCSAYFHGPDGVFRCDGSTQGHRER